MPVQPSNPARLFKLGKLPARHDARTLQLAKYLKPTGLPPAPSQQEFFKKVKQWPMMVNDRTGDCTCAAVGHMIQQWTTYTGAPSVPDDEAILEVYSAVSGYDPATGANDNGAYLLDVLNYWRHNGISGHSIAAFVGLEQRNHSHLEDAMFLFGNVYIGLGLPLSAQDQDVWAVPPSGAVGSGAPYSWGGHAVPVVAYDHRGLTVVTWGSTKRMTWSFLDTYCDEAFAVLSQDWIDKTTNVTPVNFDLEALQKDLQLLGAGTPAMAGAARAAR